MASITLNHHLTMNVPQAPPKHRLYLFAGLALTAVMLMIPTGSAQAQAAGNEWTTPSGTVEGTRFSSLSEINAGNVGGLKQEFQFSTGVKAGHQGAPLVVGKTMYVVGPYPNKLFALDLTRPGQTRWVFSPGPDEFANGEACCDIVNRGAVFANGKVIYNALDNTTVAVDAVSGKEVWLKADSTIWPEPSKLSVATSPEDSPTPCDTAQTSDIVASMIVSRRLLPWPPQQLQLSSTSQPLIQMRSPTHSQPRARKLVVLGIGNTLMSDDGVGIHVIRELQGRQKDRLLPEGNIEILDGGTLGFLLVDRLAGADGMVVVDAANLGEAAGSVRVIDDAEIDRFLDDNPSLSVHEVGLVDLLQMMALSGQTPRLRALVGIQPEMIDWGTEMSPSVAAGVPKASRAVTQVLTQWIEQG
jgi:hydrogenase maturation protease